MLDDDISLFMHTFPEADDRELRAHCLSTLLEYEESMRIWEEAKDSGELDSDGSSSEDEDLPASSYCETWTRLRRAPPQMQPWLRGPADLNGPRRFCSRPT
jgi:hypothetical protein